MFTKIKSPSTQHSLIISENSSAVSEKSVPPLELFKKTFCRKKEQQEVKIGFIQHRSKF